MKRINFIFLTLIISLLNISAQSLPDGYKNIKLGMSLEETKNALEKNADLGYHGDRDVSLLPGENKILIETDSQKGYGSDFLERCWFQFYNEKLYIITININPKRMDYYSMFKKFSDKYGDPDQLDPSKSVWMDDSVTIMLEKPLSVKYIDNKTYEEIQNMSTVEKSGEEYTREMFLEDF